MFTRKTGKNSEAGFTLVEIAIVLVIIGLLIGGVLKGQELIQNARVKRVMKQVDEFRVAFTTYQDRYGFMPGDDNNAVARFPAAAGLVNGNGNGQVAVGESPDAFMHLAAAGLISGTYTIAATSFPRNPFGGASNVQYFTPPGAATNGHWFQTIGIPGNIGAIIDSSYDDGVWNTGSILASAAYTGANVNMYIQF